MILDKEKIAERRVPLAEAEISLERQGKFRCHFCNKNFKSEVVFMKHHCEQKRRHQELLSPIGQAAYSFYREWMRLRKFREQSSAAFLESRYYRAFINFASLVQAANIGKPSKYIQLMVEADVQPPLWCRDSAYALYLDWVDRQSDPLEEVQHSIEYLIELAEKREVDLQRILEVLDPQEVLSLIRQRRLSPWFVFNSKKFGEMLRSLSKDELKAFNLVINSSHWAKKFQENAQLISQIKQIISEMGL